MVSPHWPPCTRPLGQTDFPSLGQDHPRGSELTPQSWTRPPSWVRANPPVLAKTPLMSWWCDFVAGWLGGSAGIVVGHPADTVKTVQQVETGSCYSAVACRQVTDRSWWTPSGTSGGRRAAGASSRACSTPSSQTERSTPSSSVCTAPCCPD